MPAADQAVLDLVGRQTQIISSQQMLHEQLRLTSTGLRTVTGQTARPTPA